MMDNFGEELKLADQNEEKERRGDRRRGNRHERERDLLNEIEFVDIVDMVEIAEMPEISEMDSTKNSLNLDLSSIEPKDQ
jgi:hypothetical protein